MNRMEQNPAHEPHKPCRSCIDFKSWSKQQRNTLNSKADVDQRSMPENEKGRFVHGCPVDKDELGRSTWSLLHTMAAQYPDKPTSGQKQQVVQFIDILSHTYPCEPCAKDLVIELKEEPVVATSNHDFSQWLCRLHNKVNVKIGKPVFDCRKVNERWRDGWRDGSCD